MEIEIDMKDLAKKTRKELIQPESVWDDYTPISEKDDVVSVYLFDGISHPSMYAELHNKLVTLTPDKQVRFYINNGGGFESGASAITQAMNLCQAPITACLSGVVASAATIVTMEADDIVVAPDTMFMIHESSFENVGGKFSDMKSFQDFYNDHTRRLTSRSYAGFLNESEIERIHNGKELWFGAEEVMERWKRRQEYLNA